MQIRGMGGAGLVQGHYRTAGALRKTNKALRKILEQLSTSQRINRAADDAAGLSISEQLRSRIRGFKAASRNVADASSALTIAEGAGREISEMVQRQRELAVAARSDTLTDEQRRGLDAEYQQLTEEITRTAESTQFNTQDVASGQGLASGSAQIQAGPEAGDAVSMPRVDLRAAALQVQGQSIATAAGAADALTAADQALDSLNTQRTTVGSMVNRFEHTAANLSVAEVNTQAAESVLRDQDMAKGLSELVRRQLLSRSATSAFARFREISSNHLLGLMQ